MGLARKHEIRDLDDALQFLDEAAQKSGREIGDIIKADYKNLRKAIGELGPEVKSSLNAVSERATGAVRHGAETATRYARDAAENVDRQAHETPWSFIAGAAIAGGALGYFLAHRK